MGLVFALPRSAWNYRGSFTGVLSPFLYKCRRTPLPCVAIAVSLVKLTTITGDSTMSTMAHFDTQDAKPVRSNYTTVRIVIYSKDFHGQSQALEAPNAFRLAGIFLTLASAQTAFFCITVLAFDFMWICEYVPGQKKKKQDLRY